MSSIYSYGNLLPFQKLAYGTGTQAVEQAAICPFAFCLCAIIQLLLPIEQITAQDFGGYVPPEECEHDEQLPEASRKICQMLKQELPQFNSMANGYAQKVAKRLDSQSGDIPSRTITLNGKTFDKVPIRPEKDQNDGHYPRGKAWQHYTGDSRTILHIERFMECFEPRQVVANPSYTQICEKVNCPEITTKEWPCHPHLNPLSPKYRQKRYVWEYYVPEYEILIAKAGSHSVDPEMFGGDENRPEFSRSKTSSTQLSIHDPQALQDLKRVHGVATDKWPGNPEWRNDEFLLQQGEESFDVTQASQMYAKALQPNFVWRFADLRPESWWEGWKVNDLSAAWCWPKRNQQVFSNSSDQQLLWKTSNIVEYTRLVSPDMWQATVNLPTQINQVGNRNQIPQNLDPSFRMARYARPYADLKRLEMQTGEAANQDKYVFYGGSIGPLTNTRFNAFTDPLRRDFFLAVTAAWEFGSKSGALKAFNTEERRQPLLTYYRNRESRPGYVGDQFKNYKIRMIDKFNNIWPGKQRSTSGAPGEPTKCGRPNNVPNMEVDGEWPKDLATKLEYDGETRWIYWNKRVACACEICGFFKGCVTLNDGDLEEDTFEGTIPGTVVGGGGLPPPFEQARPHWIRLASATSPRGNNAPHPNGFQIPGNLDGGSPGPLKGILNQDTSVVPQQPPTPIEEEEPIDGPQDPGQEPKEEPKEEPKDEEKPDEGKEPPQEEPPAEQPPADPPANPPPGPKPGPSEGMLKVRANAETSQTAKVVKPPKPMLYLQGEAAKNDSHRF